MITCLAWVKIKAKGRQWDGAGWMGSDAKTQAQQPVDSNEIRYPERREPVKSDKKIIYFLCTGNACRSQMAEGFGKKYLGDRFNVYSAGIEAHGLNPKAVKVMAEKGIDISCQTSDVIEPELLNKADYVITLCGDANDKCPMTPPHVHRDHWGLDDPAKAQGAEEEVWEVFRRVRDQIEARIIKFAKERK
jgi:arsenate reductase (thioredoxin)